jgi:hypothetical protein
MTIVGSINYFVARQAALAVRKVRGTPEALQPGIAVAPVAHVRGPELHIVDSRTGENRVLYDPSGLPAEQYRLAEEMSHVIDINK